MLDRLYLIAARCGETERLCLAVAEVEHEGKRTALLVRLRVDTEGHDIRRDISDGDGPEIRRGVAGLRILIVVGVAALILAARLVAVVLRALRRQDACKYA